MNISVCITILNEEDSIVSLLDSLGKGSLKPDEIIIVDGGSSDDSVIKIKEFQKKYSNIKLIVKKGGIAKSRNLAINSAHNEIIAQTDAGCVVKKDWLEKLVKPFSNKKVDIVAGFYEMVANNPLHEAINVFHGISPQNFNPNTFVPSARSCAFRKAVWKKLGGYDDKLNTTGEDTLFFYKAVKNNFFIKRVGDARVIWEETGRYTLLTFCTKFFNYAKGDLQSGIWWDPNKQFESHNIKILLVYLRYFVGITLGLLAIIGYFSPLFPALLLVLYLIWPVYKWREIVTSTQGRLWLPIIQILSDFSVMLGFLSGILEENGLF